MDNKGGAEDEASVRTLQPRACTSTHTHAHTSPRMSTRARTHARAHAHTHAYAFAQPRTPIRARAHMCARAYTHTRALPMMRCNTQQHTQWHLTSSAQAQTLALSVCSCVLTHLHTFAKWGALVILSLLSEIIPVRMTGACAVAASAATVTVVEALLMLSFPGLLRTPRYMLAF
eukprot:6203814-Pleurochrysis_carterae.AAC.3